MPQTLSEFLKPESILVPLKAVSRDEAISALIDVLALQGSLHEGRDTLKAAMIAREKAGSTGLGNGVAVPHARSPRITAPMMSAGLLAPPIDFGSADGKPVSLVLLLAVPEADPTAHLKALAALSRLASDKKLLRRINKAASSRELHDLISGFPL